MTYDQAETTPKATPYEAMLTSNMELRAITDRLSDPNQPPIEKAINRKILSDLSRGVSDGKNTFNLGTLGNELTVDTQEHILTKSLNDLSVSLDQRFFKLDMGRATDAKDRTSHPEVLAETTAMLNMANVAIKKHIGDVTNELKSTEFSMEDSDKENMAKEIVALIETITDHLSTTLYGEYYRQMMHPENPKAQEFENLIPKISDCINSLNARDVLFGKKFTEYIHSNLNKVKNKVNKWVDNFTGKRTVKKENRSKLSKMFDTIKNFPDNKKEAKAEAMAEAARGDLLKTLDAIDEVLLEIRSSPQDYPLASNPFLNKLTEFMMT
jgi:hypothetical protein